MGFNALKWNLQTFNGKIFAADTLNRLFAFFKKISKQNLGFLGLFSEEMFGNEIA